jgi:GAF domain-containing protein
MDMPERLMQRIDAVNRTLRTQRTLPAKLEAVAEVLERVVPACDSVSIALVAHGLVATGAVSGQLAVEADLVQYDQHEGPCLMAVAEATTVRVDVLDQDERFEHFAPGAIRAGVESSYSIPLVHQGNVVGSLNLYSATAQAFSRSVEEHVRPITEYAATLIGRSPLYAYSLELVDELAATVTERDDIAQAVGVLMGEGHSEEEAWYGLRQAAVDRDCSLGEAAADIADSNRGDEPETAAGGD